MIFKRAKLPLFSFQSCGITIGIVSDVDSPFKFLPYGTEEILVLHPDEIDFKILFYNHDLFRGIDRFKAGVKADKKFIASAFHF